jgi:HPt (histidine-containing phosphotransfer) domain-containing protein
MTELPGAVDTTAFAQLRANVGDDQEFVAELVDEFLQDAPRQLESLRQATISGDATVAVRAAHTLKGNSRSFGATQLASICQDAETAAAEGDLEAVRSRLDAIDGEWQTVSAELIALRDGHV